VKTVQRILGLPQTGVFGRRTHDAVVQFQLAHRIAPAEGIVGPVTWQVLRRVKPATPVVTTAPTTVTAPSPAPVVTATSDPTMTATMRDSRAARLALGLAAWQSSAHGKAIAVRESGGRCTAVSPSGAYRGKWQVSATFWKANGGTSFAATADQATCAQQDLVAYRGWVTSWWMPWGG
jgi:peptidoglycan hydrolase-like protein with peptidoglycan-binding domain